MADELPACVRAVVIQGDKILLVKRVKFGEVYYTLPGGHVEAGETFEAAVCRELMEETSLLVTEARKIFIEPATNGFLPQHIFVCSVKGSKIVLSPDSDEAKLNKIGKNTYEPDWYPVSQLPALPFRTTRLASALVSAIQEGWPDYVVELTSGG